MIQKSVTAYEVLPVEEFVMEEIRRSGNKLELIINLSFDLIKRLTKAERREK